MKKTYFIAGTDTDVGKTAIACGLLTALNQQDVTTLALKPVAAGCHDTEQGLRNQDALDLMSCMSLQLPYEQVNPITVAEPIAPHIGLAKAGRKVSVSQLEGICRGALLLKADVALIEGAGGWRLPLNDREFLSDLAVRLSTPVVLVVGVRLGCLNHSLLTAEAIIRDGLPLAGWVANHIDPQAEETEQNIRYLQQALPAPLLGEVPFIKNQTPQVIAQSLNVSPLLEYTSA